MNVAVIGLGEVGSQTYEMLVADGLHRIVGVEINPERAKQFTGEVVAEVPKGMDVYVVCAYKGSDIHELIEEIGPGPLIVVESTISPRMAHWLATDLKREGYNLVAFPHRLVPGDPAHGADNIDRIVGFALSDPEKKNNFYALYEGPISPELLHEASFIEAAVSKVVENAYRYMEIVLAQELKLALEGLVDFEAVRTLCNTKWNIDIREARQGVMGKCLPKDMRLLYESTQHEFFGQMIEKNEAYKKKSS